ncbi:MAG: hypothetical protein ACD_77C00355G0002 [uncultured bacterium]|nr:MAG: hypothetical protein ACD_77C00355G0002 [uncultured bacterium]HBY02356.1 hypothetical protein [Rikenellaceae bacterium]
MKSKILTILAILILNQLNAQSLFTDTQPDSSSVTDNVMSRKTEINGFVRGSFYGGSKNYDLTSVFAQFALKARYKSKHTILHSEIWFRGGMKFGEYYNKLDIVEAYAGYISDKFDFLAGNQIVKWGRTDGFSPTNNINAKDYFFFTSDPDDQVLSNFMVRAKYRINPEIDIDLIGIPYYNPSNYRFDLFALGEYASFVDPTLPDGKFKSGAVAAKLNFELSKIGFSLSYFRGYDPFHGFNVKTINLDVTNPNPSPEILYTSTSYHKQTFGADFAIPAGNWILRGEFAYNHTKGSNMFMFIAAPDISYVAAFEKDFGGYLAIFQYIGKYVPNFKPLIEPVLENPENPMSQLLYLQNMVYYQSTLFNRKIFNQQKNTNHALSLTVRKSLAYETITGELTGYYNITSKEYMIRPKVSWNATDNLSFSLGGSYMHGPAESLFNYSAPVMNGFFLEIKASF